MGKRRRRDASDSDTSSSSSSSSSSEAKRLRKERKRLRKEKKRLKKEMKRTRRAGSPPAARAARPAEGPARAAAAPARALSFLAPLSTGTVQNDRSGAYAGAGWSRRAAAGRDRGDGRPLTALQRAHREALAPRDSALEVLARRKPEDAR